MAPTVIKEHPPTHAEEHNIFKLDHTSDLNQCCVLVSVDYSM